MMKKMLIFVTVLAIASAASAATMTIQVSGGGSTVFETGVAVTLEVIPSGFADTEVGGGELGQMIINAITDSGNGSAVPGTVNAQFDAAKDKGAAGTLPNLITGISGAVDATEYDGSDDLNNGLVAYNFVYTPGTTLSGTIDLSGLTTFNCFGDPVAVSGVGLTYTPEPITIALLGLGGLFLRRRK